MKTIISLISLLLCFSTYANDLRSISCGGYSLSRNEFLRTLDSLQPGESDPTFETVFIFRAGRPPASFPAGLYVIHPDSERYQLSNDLLKHSLELVPQAIAELAVNPSLLERYRKSCVLDDSTDEEVLGRGVEVMQWVAHFSDGTLLKSEYFTSLRPDAVVDIDNNRINAFLQYVQSHENFENFSHIEVLHNHPLLDSLTITDVEYASNISFHIKSRFMITAIVKEGDKLSESRSTIYRGGLRE